MIGRPALYTVAFKAVVVMRYRVIHYFIAMILSHLEGSIGAVFDMPGLRLGPLPPPPPPAPNPLTLGSFLTRFSAPLESVLIGVRVAAE